MGVKKLNQLKLSHSSNITYIKPADNFPTVELKSLTPLGYISVVNNPMLILMDVCKL